MVGSKMIEEILLVMPSDFYLTKKAEIYPPLSKLPKLVLKQIPSRNFSDKLLCVYSYIPGETVSVAIATHDSLNVNPLIGANKGSWKTVKPLHFEKKTQM